jgi:hypothetical protein
MEQVPVLAQDIIVELSCSPILQRFTKLAQVTDSYFN